jgi:hypothetical protein
MSEDYGSRPLPTDRDTLGHLVREAWVRWALTQPNPKPSWLVPYDELSEPDKEADRQIGEAIARWTIIHAAADEMLDQDATAALSAAPARPLDVDWKARAERAEAALREIDPAALDAAERTWSTWPVGVGVALDIKLRRAIRAYHAALAQKDAAP